MKSGLTWQVHADFSFESGRYERDCNLPCMHCLFHERIAAFLYGIHYFRGETSQSDSIYFPSRIRQRCASRL
jgi:hypothetical protein